MGEVFEAVREKQSFENLSDEVADVFWILLQFCELRDINIDRFFRKTEEERKKTAFRASN